MANKVTWRKGMRLTTGIFDAMDNTHNHDIRVVAELASARRFGLFPSIKQFEISVNINNNILEVVSLRCHGLTKSGQIVDIDFDSNYSNTFDSRIQIPYTDDNSGLILIVRMHENEWREVDETFSEAAYTFELIGENNRIGDNCLPVASIVNQYGWRLDETVFVPPCLYISAHYKYEEQLSKAIRIFKAVYDKCLTANNCVAKQLLSSIWPMASCSYHRLDKERDTLSPAQLYSTVQQFISAFLIGCSLDDYVCLENYTPFVAYTQKPYDMRTLYTDIETGLTLCDEINIKMDAVCSMTAVRPAPVEPDPKPQPASEPVKSGRNRWEGIEI